MSVGRRWNGSRLAAENRSTWGTTLFSVSLHPPKIPHTFGCRDEMMPLTTKNVAVADFSVLYRHWQNV
jgi:hypothetical protein